MKNKKLLAVILVVAVAAAAVAIALSNRLSSIFEVENKDDGSISVTAQKTGQGATGMGYITIEDGQALKVRSNLTDSSSIKIEVLPRVTDATTKVLFEETFSAIDARSFEFPAGQYSVRITAEKEATGTMDITSE